MQVNDRDVRRQDDEVRLVGCNKLFGRAWIATHMPMGLPMKCLVFYGTAEGHTLKIARNISEMIESAGHEVRLQDAYKRVADIEFGEFDAFVAAAPVHQQRHPDAVIDFIKVHAASLNALPSALVSVSLAAAFEDGHRDAQAYVDRLLERTGWRPTTVHLAAGALNPEKYDYFQEQIIRHVVLKDREPDEIVGDHDFTDWDALAQFVKDFEVASSAVKSIPGAGGSFP